MHGHDQADGFSQNEITEALSGRFVSPGSAELRLAGQDVYRGAVFIKPESPAFIQSP